MKTSIDNSVVEQSAILNVRSPPLALSSPHQVNKYAKELLAAMSSGMEEKEDPGKLQLQVLTCSVSQAHCICVSFITVKV
jgi:hypothetical protein